MDSSSVATANSNSRGDASSSSDADLISVTQTLAKEACVLFQLGKYADCLKVLSQILEKKADDPKIHHNIAVVENFQDGFSNPKRFLEALEDLKKRSESLAHSSGENAEVLNNRSKAVGNKGTNNVNNQVSTINSSQGIAVDDFDVSVMMFNTAVTFYHVHEYKKCFSILERLYQNIEPIDERVARHVCLLLLDVSFLCNHVSRAADVINYLERVGGNNQGDSGPLSQQQVTNIVTKSTSAPSNVLLPDSDPSNGPESPLSRTLSEENLLESLMSTLDVSGAQNLTRPSNDLQRTQTDDSLPDLRLKVHLYKVWLLIITRNLKAAKREVKMTMNITRGKDHVLNVFIKSQLECARGNHKKALRLLTALTEESPSYYNNLGCIYYQLGKYQTSSFFFKKALDTCSLLRKENPKKLLVSSQDKSSIFMYNCGLVYLASRKLALAAKCFRQASSVFVKRPLFWLRIAECCIIASEKKTDINVNVISSGKWRQLAVHYKKLQNVDPNLSLTCAADCLKNALHLLDKASNPDLGTDPDPNLNPKMGVGSNGEAKELKAGNSGLLQSSISEYEGLCGKENQMILQAVHADMAFVYLELENPLKALGSAKSLLRLPDCSKVYAFLGNLYAAEAYCLLDQPEQALNHLSGYISGELPYSQHDCDMWQPRKSTDVDEANAAAEEQAAIFLKPEEARAVLMADIGAVAAAQGDMERAQEAVSFALSVVPDNQEVVLTATYIDLVCGRTRDAVAKLRQCSSVRFLPSGM